MATRHPKSIRRQLLLTMYKRYLRDPLEMLEPADLMDQAGVTREELLPNMFYLYDRGLAELMTAYSQSLFASARITPDGIDMVENHYQFNLLFPAAPGDDEEAMGRAPELMERVFQEAELSALDGEARQSLLRDAQFLREELARPVDRWRFNVIETVLDWMEGYFEGHDHYLPSIRELREILKQGPS